MFKSNPISYNDNTGKRNPYAKGSRSSRSIKLKLLLLVGVAFVCGAVLH